MSYKISNEFPLVFGLTGFMVLLFSCVDNPEKQNQQTISKTPVLENLANTVIIPGYESLNTKILLMDEAVRTFSDDPNGENLISLRQNFMDAYTAWQKVSFLDFGPAFTETLRAELNTFPTDNFSIENAIKSGQFSFEGFSSQNRRGLPALEYLIYGSADTDEGILQKFTTDPVAENRKEYLLSISQLALNKVDLVHNSWLPEGGNYKEGFIMADGTDVGSSFGIMVNSISQYLERFTRDARIGIPLGKRSQGTIIPRNVEAYYSGESVHLAHEHLGGIRDFYLGKNGDQDGMGFFDFLREIKAGSDEKLADRILSQLDLALDKLDQVPSPLSETVQSNPAPVEAAHAELQKLVILIKTEFSSALGVLITYQDNDGD